MKRLISLVLCTILGFLAVFPLWTYAAETGLTMPRVGDLATELDIEAMEGAGYIIVDDRDAAITYTWPYTLDPVRITSGTALGGTLMSQFGQVSATISYTFSGTYLAVLFAEHHYAADIIVTIDGISYTAHNPHNAAAPAGDLEGGVSRVVFVKDDLPEGEHEVRITHKPAYNSGDENLKQDGKKYYDNVALFDAFIVKELYSDSVDDLKVGNKTHLYDDALLDSLNLKVIDDTDEGILYTWPYDLDGARISNFGAAMGGTMHFNLGQVSATTTVLFEGSVLAIAFCETYYACKVIVDVDGEILGEFIPRTTVRPNTSDIPEESRIFFVKTDLKPGYHILTLTHETAYESGEPNTKPDGQSYYDNNAYFDCILVQKTPDAPETEPNTEPVTAPVTEIPTEPVTDPVTPLNEETTILSETNAEPVVTAETAEETSAPSGGCGSVLPMGSAIITVVAGVLAAKRRRKQYA